MRVRLATLAWLTALSLHAAVSPATRAEDSLVDLRQEVRTEDLSAPSQPREERPTSYADDARSDNPWDDDSDDSDLVMTGLGVAAVAATVPFWGPPSLIGDSRLVNGYFPRYPYKNRGGYMWIGEPVGDVYIAAVRARSDFGTNFGRLHWVGGNLLVESTMRLGGETDFRVLSEHAFGSRADSATLGDANLFYRFAQSDQFQGRSGIGFNYMVDQYDSNYGFNFTYAVDWYPVKPIIVSAELDLGWLGEESLFHFRLTEGLNWKYGEAFVGYDYYDVGTFQLGGLVAGVRLWF